MKHGDRIKEQILNAGLEILRSNPAKVNARSIAKLIGKTHAAIYYHYPDKESLMKAVISHGVAKNDSFVIVNLILTKNSAVENMSEDERQKHLDVVRSYAQ